MGEAANGKDAMDQIEKLQPQIVISDVVMPLMDGVDFTVAVHHRYPHIQMIILSGYDNFEYVKQTLMQGVVDYILKPTLTPHELLGVLQKAAARIPGWHPDHAMTGGTAQRIAARGNKNRRRTAKGICRIICCYQCLPLTRPICPWCVSSCNNYLWPKVIMMDDSSQTMPMLVANLSSGYSIDYGVLMLGVLICSLPTGILFLVLQKSFANGIVGAVKG